MFKTLLDGEINSVGMNTIPKDHFNGFDKKEKI